MIERSQVRVPAGTAVAFSSLGSAFYADSYSGGMLQIKPCTLRMWLSVK